MLLPEPLMLVRKSIKEAKTQDLIIPEEFTIGVILYSSMCLEKYRILSPKSAIGTEPLPAQSSRLGYVVPANVRTHQIYTHEPLFTEQVSWVVSLLEHLESKTRLGPVDYKVIMIAAGYDEIKDLIRAKDEVQLEAIARDFVECLAQVALNQENSVVVFTGCIVNEKGFDSHPALFLKKVWSVLEEVKSGDGELAQQLSKVFYIDVHTLNYPESVVRDGAEQLGYIKGHVVHFLNKIIGFALTNIPAVPSANEEQEVAHGSDDDGSQSALKSDVQASSSSGEESSSDEENTQ
jgi:hypothetical protein